MKSRAGYGVASQCVRAAVLDSKGVLRIGGLHHAPHDQVIVAVEIQENAIGKCPYNGRVFNGSVGRGGEVNAVLLNAPGHHIVEKIALL
jgi:hypothetical protein